MLRTPFVYALFFLASISAFCGDKVPSREVHQITIHSAWGGLGTPRNVEITITRNQDGFMRDGKAVDKALVNGLLEALTSPRIAKPEMSNMGISDDWLRANVAHQEPRSWAQATPTTKGQLALFKSTYTNSKAIAGLLPSLFKSWHTDDYPGVKVEVYFEDGSHLFASTHSQYVFMLPWCVGEQKSETFNADISRAVSALLPRGRVNKERLTGPGLAKELTEAVMASIETEWNLKGAEEMVGDALASIRQKYQITNTEITPYHHPEYGTATYKGEPEEVNLHAMLRKNSFPRNVSVALVLKDNKGRVEGIPQFLDSADKYEDLVFSVPWLRKFIQDNPKAHFRISYVHNASFGEKAMRTFAGDMKLRERDDLVAKVKAQQSEIALLMVGMTYSESYWLVFPDKHMVLWRYQGPSGLLKWSPADFGEGECADYRVNNGGCSGREVDANGVLVPEGTPRDVACVSAWHTKHSATSGHTGPLFEVMDHGRSGFINSEGEIAIPLCFDTVGDFSEGLARFERDGKWGYLDQTGTIVIQPKFPWAEEFHEGLAHVQVTGTTLGYDGRWGYIDKTGTVVIDPQYPRMLVDEDGEESAFHDGFAMIEVGGESGPSRKGFIDKNGKVAIPARFTYAYPFSEGLAAVTESESGDSGWGYIDKTGRWVIPPKFEWTTSFQFGLAAVNRKNTCGYIDKTGSYAIRLPAPGGKQDCASAWGDFSDGLSRWLFGTKYGFVDLSGKTVIEPRFDLTFGFSEGLAAVMIGKKWGFIDKTGTVVIEPQDLSTVKPFHHGLARVVTRDGHWGYIDKSGKFVWQPTQQGND